MKQCYLIIIIFFSTCNYANDDLFSDTQSKKPFLQQLNGLNDEQIDLFFLGRSFFTKPWVAAPSATTARDGLGPLFNASTCATCHPDHSSANALDDNGQPLHGLVLKFGQPSKHEQKAAQEMLIGDPHYGVQLGVNSTGEVPREAVLQLERREREVYFGDGRKALLTKFIPQLHQLAYGELAADTQVTLRQAPALVGVGLIDKVSAEEILKYADPDDSNNDGISGRANWVYDRLSGEFVIGKFSHKASQGSALAQTADAAANDMGLTNPYFEQEQCTAYQTACRNAPRGRDTPQGTLDMPMLRLNAITFYIKNFKAPQQRRLSAMATQGKQIFHDIGCTSCHRSSMTTSDGIKFAPYGDFLLHDMGAELADGRAEFLATPREWRTMPLWGIGNRIKNDKRFLHDARAASVEEAILWHGGEARGARQRFIDLTTQQQLALRQFLEEL